MKPKPAKKFAIIPNRRRCPDYDSECVDVRDPLECYLGCGGELERADGYCPLILGIPALDDEKPGA